MKVERNGKVYESLELKDTDILNPCEVKNKICAFLDYRRCAFPEIPCTAGKYYNGERLEKDIIWIEVPKT